MPQLELIDTVWYGATLRQWLFAAGTFVLVYTALALVRGFLSRRLGMLALRTRTEWDDAFAEIARRTRWYFLVVVAVYAATRVVTPSATMATLLRAAAVLAVLLQAGHWGNAVIGTAVNYYTRLRAGDDIGTRATINAIGYAARFGLWMILVVTALDAFGINVTALVTGLGIGGVAIALAVQNILGDLFAALAIVLDKPFVVGDFIIVDTTLGTVEHVGLKTTRIRSLGGEQIIVSNNDLLKSRIRNYKRMQERRVVFNLDVTYGTPAEKVALVPRIVRSVIESTPQTRFDRSHFFHFMDSSLRIETVYWVLDPDYNKYADIQQTINLELLRRLSAEEIEFAFPSRTVFVRGEVR